MVCGGVLGVEVDLDDVRSDMPHSIFDGPWPPEEDVIAIGGRLEPGLVLDAYAHGVFPFYSAGEPVLWWCPDPRAVLPLDAGAVPIPRRLGRTLRQGRFDVRVNSAFEDVMRACDELRADGTWIHGEMMECYTELHAQGHAHSVEVWREDALVGGVYGVAVGGMFAAESKFHRERDMSKVALVHLLQRLREREFELLDVQFKTPHLERFGCVELSREDYLARVRRARSSPARFD